MTRVAITLDKHAHTELARRAQAAAEPMARTAARFVRDGLLTTNGTPTPPEPSEANGDPEPSGRAPWLEPGPDARQRWRREVWSAVCALHDRYSHALRKLPAEWWADRSLVETLAALAAWRAQLDNGAGHDPRAELLFHDRLELLQRRLDANDDLSLANDDFSHFHGGPPPPTWVQ